MVLTAKEQTQQFIQQRLAEIGGQLQEVIDLADKHHLEFSFMGATMHYHDRRARGPGLTGILVGDTEWQSSSFGCSSKYWEWHAEAFPEDGE